MNRQKIANIIDRQSHTDWICTAYDWFMVLAILVSLLPLMFMKSHKAFWYTELGSTLVFIIDYLLRWGTADIRNNNRKTVPYLSVFCYGNHRPAVHLACRYAAQPSLQAVPLRASAKTYKGFENAWNFK